MIPLGQQISGTLTGADEYWATYYPDTHHLLYEGYLEYYKVRVTAGHTYTVTFWTSSGKGFFEDPAPDGSTGPMAAASVAPTSR